MLPKPLKLATYAMLSKSTQMFIILPPEPVTKSILFQPGQPQSLLAISALQQLLMEFINTIQLEDLTLKFKHQLTI
jgi:hypothetical protein